MGFRKWDHRSGLQRDNIDMHIMAQVLRIDEAGCGPGAIGVGHCNRRLLALMSHEGGWLCNAIDRAIRLSNPVKQSAPFALAVYFPFATSRQIGVAARTQGVLNALHAEV